MRIGSWERAVARAAVLSAVAFVALFASATAAFAATTFASAVPTAVANTVKLDSVTVQVRANDPAQIKSASLVLDGVAKTPSIAYDGYWDGDGCDSWFVPDPTNATIAYRIPSVSVGTHSVTVRVTNGSGAVSTYSWSFAVAPADMTFSAASPAPGSTIPIWNPEVHVSLIDAAGPADGPSVTIDGARFAVPMRFGDQRFTTDDWNDIIYNALPWEVPTVDWTKGYVTYTPASLSDGVHQVSVTAPNTTGRTSTYAWSFTVAAPPQITGKLPADGSSVSTQSPVISANIADNGTIASMKMSVDGVQIPAAFDAATKTFSYRPSSLANDATHTVRVDTADTGGLSSSAEWKFKVQTYADMPVNSVCESCHDVSRHPIDNCDACHTVVPIGHGLPYQPASRCLQCHGRHGTNVITPGVTWGGGDEPQPGYTGYWGGYCTVCHTATYPSIPRHPDDLASFHDTKTDVTSCAPCHVQSLTREHNRYGKTCDTCHGASASANVKAAVAAGDSQCTSCHDFSASGDAHEAVHAPAGLDSQCTTCHADSLTKEHLTNWTASGKGISCQSCHASTDARVGWSVFAGDKKCNACHVSAHALGMAPAPTGIPQYPGYRWSTPIDSALFAGESWLGAGFGASGQLIISNRRTDVTLSQIWDFYRTQLGAAGWALVSGAPASGDTSFKATFSKGSHTAVVWFYGGEGHSATPMVSSGSRVEVLYR